MSVIKARRGCHILVIVSVLLLLYICYIQMERNEISDVHFIQMFCIDKTDDGFQVSALYNDGGSQRSDKLQFVEGNGNTVYTAFEDLKRKDSKELTITHTAYYLLSTSAAEYGLPECLDFISRDESVKTNASVYILKEDNANKVLNGAIKDKLLPQEILNYISQKQTHTMKKADNTLMTVLNNMNNPYNNLLIPALSYKDKNMYLDGYATFKTAKLYKYLDYKTSQYIDLFRNRLRTCPLSLGNDLTMELTDLKVNQTVTIENDRLNLTVGLQTNSELKEVAAYTNVFHDAALNKIQNLEIKSLNAQFYSIIKQMQKDNLDLLDISTYLSNESNTTDDSYKKNWNSYLKNMSYHLNVDSTIAKNYIITK